MRHRNPNIYRRSNAALMNSVSKDFFQVKYDVDTRTVPRVLIHPADSGGCGHYRLIYPAKAMEERNNIETLITKRLFKPHELGRFNPDTVIVQRQVLDGQIGYIERSTKLNQIFTVYELDDLLDNVQDKNVHKKDFNQRHFQNLYKGLRGVDRFVCSTEFLKDAYKNYCHDIVVMNNRLNPDPWKTLVPKRNTSQKLRIGWAGGFSHTGDLEIIVDTLKTLYKEFDFVFLGYIHPDIEKYVAEFHAGSSFYTYPQTLANLNLDLALAPLEDVPFNHAKSHLKVIEYGALGYPVLATKITPYLNFPINYPKTNDAQGFIDAIREMTADRDALYKMGDNLREFVYAHWMLENEHIDRWQAAWLPS